MGYSRPPIRAKDLPGPSIRGAGTLSPGTYQGLVEVKGSALYFTALPHGLHVEELSIDGKWDGQEALAVIAICSGAILRRSTNGQMCFAQHDTKEPLTGWHSSLTPLLDEAAKAKLKFAAPEIVSLISKAGEKIYERADNFDSNHSAAEPI